MSDMKAEDVLAASAGMMASLTARAQAAEARCADLQARCERLETGAADMRERAATRAYNMLKASEGRCAVRDAIRALPLPTEKAAPAGEG